uniref:Peptidase S74 domain-containing protein n=1 Tax=Micromonas commoda virus TaxID=3057169 RepID=A0AAU7YQI1_9PHYC
MSETNIQLFPGVFRSTVGGANPGFFLHSDGRVGIGNTAPTTRPVWSSDDNDRNKLNVSGHTHIEGNLNVTGYVYGDGSNLTGTSLPWQQSAPNVATDIKYEGGNVGIGGAASANKLKVYGTVEATSFSGIQESDVPTLGVSKISGLGTFATKNDGNYNIHDTWLRDNGDNAHVKLYGNSRQMTFRTDGTTEYASGIGGYPFAWMYGGDHSSQRIMLLNTSGQLWCSNYGWLHDKFADRHGNSGYNFYTSTIFIGGSTSRGLRSVTGDYGTVQTTGGGSNGWEGYSIDGRYVFMSTSNNSCGIYNDIDNDWMIYCYRNNYTKLYFDGAERFETGNPNLINNAGLRIYGVEHSQDYADADHDYWQNWNQIQGDTGYTHFGLYVDNAIRTYKYVALSDRRIKKDFLEIDDTIALGKLRQLKPTSYRYKDKWRRTTDRVLGFIAQEVAEVLPDAVSITNAVIPNIQIEASVKKIDEKKFEFTLKEPYVVTVGSKLELKGPKIGHKEVEVISVTDDTTFTGTVEDFDIEKVGDRVIVYGEYVDDFHNLDKNAIFTVATAALQEVDRQLQAEKEKVKSLEERLAALEAIVLNQ